MNCDYYRFEVPATKQTICTHTGRNAVLHNCAVHTTPSRNLGFGTGSYVTCKVDTSTVAFGSNKLECLEFVSVVYEN